MMRRNPEHHAPTPIHDSWAAGSSPAYSATRGLNLTMLEQDHKPDEAIEREAGQPSAPQSGNLGLIQSFLMTWLRRHYAVLRGRPPSRPFT